MMTRFAFAFGAPLLALSMLGVGSSVAHAHIKLLKPASWLVEDDLGDPQKVGPCGNSGTQTNMVTTFQAGQMIEVEWQETIYHPGHFRIAVVKDRSELKDPDVEVDSSCNYEAGSISSTAVPPVLADNLYPRTPAFGAAQSFKQMVKLPNEPCEKCTLQLIQFMTSHSRPCIYYHCADIKIVAAGGSAGAAGGSAGAAGAGQAGATAGAGVTAGSGGSGMMMMTAGQGGMAMRPVPSSGGTGGTSMGTTTGGGGMPGIMAAPAGSTAPAPGANPTAKSADEGGCSAAGSTGAHALPSIALALLILGAHRRRYR